MRIRLRRLLLQVLACGGSGFVTRRPEPDIEGEAPRRILLVKPDHLGDLLLTTPALRLLRQQHPTAQIVLLAGPWSAVIVERNPDIDTVLTFPFPGFQRQAAMVQRARIGLFVPYLQLVKLALLLRAGRFDAALLLRDDHWWGAALVLLAGIPRRVGYAMPECVPFLSHALPWRPAEHVTLQALRLVQVLAPISSPVIDGATYLLRYTPADEDKSWLAAWLHEHRIEAETRLLLLHAGTGGAAKLWLPARWAAVLNELATDGQRVVLTGSAAERTLVSAIAEQLERPPLLLAGETTLGQLAALCGRASLVLGVDSGPLHLAVSQQTPSVHLFGPSDQQRFGPWGDPWCHVVLRSGLWCSPCGVFVACPRQTNPPECMAALTVGEVVATARRLLAATEQSV